MDSKHKHLELIQGVINRFSTNSFLLKGWSVVLVSALFALSAPNSRVEFVYLAYIPAIIFWGLDGFFLWQEQLFRKLYDRVRVLPDDEVDFSMNTSVIKGDVASGMVKNFFPSAVEYGKDFAQAVSHTPGARVSPEFRLRPSLSD